MLVHKKSWVLPVFVRRNLPVLVFLSSGKNKFTQGNLFGFSQVVLLMRNLSVNLTSPEFEDHVSTCLTLVKLLTTLFFVKFTCDASTPSENLN
jgi:hypothetical protein